jgi:hypothetical protein
MNQLFFFNAVWYSITCLFVFHSVPFYSFILIVQSNGFYYNIFLHDPLVLSPSHQSPSSSQIALPFLNLNFIYERKHTIFVFLSLVYFALYFPTNNVILFFFTDEKFYYVYIPHFIYPLIC